MECWEQRSRTNDFSSDKVSDNLTEDFFKDYDINGYKMDINGPMIVIYLKNCLMIAIYIEQIDYVILDTLSNYCHLLDKLSND